VNSQLHSFGASRHANEFPLPGAGTASVLVFNNLVNDWREFGVSSDLVSARADLGVFGDYVLRADQDRLAFAISNWQPRAYFNNAHTVPFLNKAEGCREKWFAQTYSICSVGERLLQALKGHYDVAANQPVAEFLEQYPFIATLLFEGIDRLRQLFGAATIPMVELLEEDDAPGYTELFATVRTNLPANEASAKLDEFDRGWWLDASLKAKGRLNFTVEYL